MINTKDLLEHFLVLGYDTQLAIKLAKQECAKRKKTGVKNSRVIKHNWFTPSE